MYQLPILPYLFQDLEPFIDTHTMGLHYHKHEQNYLNKLNELLRKNRYDYRYLLEELIYHIDEFLPADQEDILYIRQKIWKLRSIYGRNEKNGFAIKRIGIHLSRYPRRRRVRPHQYF